MLANSLFPTSIKSLFVIPSALSIFSDLNLGEKVSKHSLVSMSLVQESLLSDLLLAMWQLSLSVPALGHHVVYVACYLSIFQYIFSHLQVSISVARPLLITDSCTFSQRAMKAGVAMVSSSHGSLLALCLKQAGQWWVEAKSWYS